MDILILTLCLAIIIAIFLLGDKFRNKYKNINTQFYTEPFDGMIARYFKYLTIFVLDFVVLFLILLVIAGWKFNERSEQELNEVKKCSAQLNMLDSMFRSHKDTTIIFFKDSPLSVDTAEIKVVYEKYFLRTDSLIKNKTDSLLWYLKNDIYSRENKSDLWLLFFFLGIIGIVLGNRLPKKWQKVAVVSLGSALTFSSIFEKLVEGELHIDIDSLIKINRACDCDTVKENPTNTTLTSIGKVGPFISGNDSLTKACFNQLQQITNSITNNGEYSEIFILGGVDKRPLKRQAKERFIDNLSLAQARANAVKTYLLNYVDEKVTPILAYAKGANYYGKVDSTLFAEDRYVIVFGRKKH